MNSKELLRSVLTAIGACVLGCNSGWAAAADTDPDKVDPCKLITQAEAQSALGMPVKPGEFVQSIIYRMCVFKAVKGGTPYVSIGLSSVDKSSFDTPDSQSERAVGTKLDAFFTRNNSDLTVWHAGNQVQIQVHFEDSVGQGGARAAELKLAATAVTRF